MESKKSPEILQAELHKQNAGVSSPNEILFDPATGELMVVNSQDLQKNQPSPDSTPITQIATDGFA